MVASFLSYHDFSHTTITVTSTINVNNGSHISMQCPLYLVNQSKLSIDGFVMHISFMSVVKIAKRK